MRASQYYSQVLAPLPAVPSRTVQYMGSQTTTTDETTTTWTGQSISTPHPKRIVVITCYAGATGGADITVNGINAYHSTRSASQDFEIQAFQVPNDTTATITAVRPSSLRKAIGVYVCYPDSHAVVDFGVATATTTTDATVSNLKLIQEGCLIYCGGQTATLGTFTTTWNGSESVTEDADAQIEVASYTWGRITGTVSSDLNDLTLAESTSGTKRLVVVTFGPPPLRRS